MSSKSNGQDYGSCSVQICPRLPSLNREREYLLRPSSHPGDSVYPNAFFISCLLVFLFVGGGIGAYLLMNQEKWQMSGVYAVVTRDSWGAKEVGVNSVRLKVPVDRVVLVDSRSEHCRTKSECVSVVQSLQAEDMQSLPDINYNFLVGGDGRVYEGRGWNYAVQGDTNSLLIALLGSFEDVQPSKIQQDELEILVQVGLNKGVVSKCYTVVIPEDRESNQRNLIEVARTIQKENLCF